MVQVKFVRKLVTSPNNKKVSDQSIGDVVELPQDVAEALEASGYVMVLKMEKPEVVEKSAEKPAEKPAKKPRKPRKPKAE